MVLSVRLVIVIYILIRTEGSCCVRCVKSGCIIVLVFIGITAWMHWKHVIETGLFHLWLQSFCAQQILKHLFFHQRSDNPPLSVSVSAAVFPFKPRHWLTGELARWDSFGFPQWKPAPTLNQAVWGMEQERRVRVGWGASAACMSQQWAQTANWFGEIQWPL